ncbi:putative RNA-binding protein [gamma proteobacterium HTCC5015]|nr:putative RNA-binding protein [gamma proteobacterium HTCC5015]
MDSLSLEGRPFIELYKLMKLEAWVESGGRAKQCIDAGLVSVDDQVETRKRCKIKAGQVVRFESYEIRIEA